MNFLGGIDYGEAVYTNSPLDWSSKFITIGVLMTGPVLVFILNWSISYLTQKVHGYNEKIENRFDKTI